MFILHIYELTLEVEGMLVEVQRGEEAATAAWLCGGSWVTPRIFLKTPCDDFWLLTSVVSPPSSLYVTTWPAVITRHSSRILTEPFPLFVGCTATIHRSLTYPVILSMPEKGERKRGVYRHFCGPGRQKLWREGKTSGEATRKCSKG